MSSKAPPPPDYTPMAKASEESSRIMKEIADRQMNFAEQQYNDTKPVFDRVVQQQMDIADKSAEQGDDYYAYLKSFRPVEKALMDEASVDRSGEIADYDAANRADAEMLTANDATIYGLNRGEIDTRVGQAVADTQGGYTRAINQAVRQGLRYGGSEGEIIDNVAGVGLTQASRIAAAANAARTDGVNSVRERTATGLQLRQANMGALNKERAINWAKKLDAAGLVKGLPGASTGAYGLAVNAGNSAGNNAAAPGSNYQAGLAAGSQSMAQGRNLKQQGLSSILNAQASQEAPADNTGAIVGGVAGIAVAVI